MSSVPVHPISRLRFAQHISQRELADAVGVSQPQISRIERGWVPQSDEVLEAIAGVLCVSVEELSSDTPPSPLEHSAMPSTGFNSSFISSRVSGRFY